MVEFVRRNTEAMLELPLRNPLCSQIEHLLTAIIIDQDTGKSQFFIDCQKEYGHDLAYALSICADTERKKKEHAKKMALSREGEA